MFMARGRIGGLTIVALTTWIGGCTPTGGFKVMPIPADLSLQERVVLRDPSWTSRRVALIDISGILMNAHEPGFFSEGEHPVSFAVEKLAAAEADSRVRAVVLRINSPGGTVTASDTIYEEILAFKKRSGKPVVAYFQDVAASGAYYLACAADEIIAQRTSVTGSIGVIMQMFDFSETMSKIGVRTDAITSGPYKDAGSPLRPMTPKEREVFQGLVDHFYEQFVKVVDAGRSDISTEQVANLANGQVYSAREALDLGMIDRIGTLHDAIEAAKRRANIKSAHTVIYDRPLGWSPNIYAQNSPPVAQNIQFFAINLPNIWTRTPRFLYIWSGER
jgi:protease-4